MKTIRVLGIAGSLRKGSYNQMLLEAAQEAVPAGMQLEIFDIAAIPFYKEDLQKQGFPQPVQELRQRVRAADALLLATPEYNHSVPAVLKNAIDWASVAPEAPLKGKPVAIMGATPHNWGTVRAQGHLRDILFGAGARAIQKPEVLVAQAAQKFDDAGKLSDEPTRKFLRQLLQAILEQAREAVAQ